MYYAPRTAGVKWPVPEGKPRKSDRPTLTSPSLPDIEYTYPTDAEKESDVLTRELAVISEAFLSCCTTKGSLDYIKDMQGHIEFLKWAFHTYNYEELCEVLRDKVNYGDHIGQQVKLPTEGVNY